MSASATQLTRTARTSILFVWLWYAQTCASRHWHLRESSVSWTNANREHVVQMSIHTPYKSHQERCKMWIIGAYMKVKLARNLPALAGAWTLIAFWHLAHWYGELIWGEVDASIIENNDYNEIKKGIGVSGITLKEEKSSTDESNK